MLIEEERGERLLTNGRREKQTEEKKQSHNGGRKTRPWTSPHPPKKLPGYPKKKKKPKTLPWG